MIKRAFEDITNFNSKHIKLTIHKSTHRKKLLRWIYEVCRDFRYSQYTFTLAVLIVDKYTEKCGFELDEYQLLGITSLFLAAKIEESKTRPVQEYSMVTDFSYSEAEIIFRERLILQTLNYDIFPKLPQFYFDVNYFSSNFGSFNLDDKKEVFNCFIASQLEKSSYSNNVFLLYLESKGEMENILSGRKVIKDSIKFYIENNHKATEILKNFELLNKPQMN